MTIAIFGAASAIAQACARRWIAVETHFFLVDQHAVRLAAVADDLRVRGAASVKTLAGDLTDEACQAAALAGAQAMGALDVALLAYGTLGDQARAEREMDETQRQLTTNFTSVAVLVQRLAAVFARQQAGTLLVIASVAGERGRASNYVYGAAKAGLAVFTAGVRHRLTRQGVRVVIIKPGFVDTPMTASFRKGLLWASPDRVARDIVRAATRRSAVVYTPWFWRWIMVIIRWMPEKVFNRLHL